MSIARVIASRVWEMAYGIGRPFRQARSALLPGCREITAQARDKPMLRGDSSVWPTRFFGLAKEHANKPRVVAAVDAESDIDVESSVPVVKSRT
jgi:hypothetical protein